MNTQDLKLYELLAEKTLSFGCKVRITCWKKDKQWFTQTWISDWFYSASPWYAIINGFNTVKIDDVIDDNSFDFDMMNLWENIYKMSSVIGHKPTLTDFHRWLKERNQNERSFWHLKDCIIINFFHWGGGIDMHEISYDCTKTLLQQSEKTKKEIIDLIESHSKKQVTTSF